MEQFINVRANPNPIFFLILAPHFKAPEGLALTHSLHAMKVYKRMKFLECPDLMFGDEIEYGIFKVIHILYTTE